MVKALILFLLPLFLAHAQDTKELQRMLDLDRFEAYVQRWSSHMGNKGLQAEAKYLMQIEPAALAKMDFKPLKLSDAFDYDKIIHRILTKNKKFAGLKLKDVSWDYNFYKRKLNDAYQVSEPSGAAKKPVKAPVVEVDKPAGVKIPTTELPAEDVLLNVDSYVSGRTTRGVFWEASQSGRKIELHVGSAGDFRTDLAARGGKIVGQVKTVERNYNPIYLIQMPGEKGYHYAITEISGADRVEHFALQSQLVTWKDGKKSGKAPPMELVGDPAEYLAREEKEITKVLQNLPKADKAVIGQKGAFERTLGGMSKSKAIRNLLKADKALVEKGLSDEMRKVLAKLLADPEFAMKGPNQLSAVEKLYDELKPVFEKLKVPPAASPAVFDLDRGSYEISDYILEGADGKPQRWRVISNSWGDEVIPVGKALKATGHKDVIYIGTAGAMPNSGLEVGDLAVPRKAQSPDGKVFKIRQSGFVPEGAKEVDTVTNVSTPFKETTSWLESTKAQAVEIETAHLAEIFSAKDDKFSAYLLISDKVGVEGETLAEASSSVRRNAQHSILTGVLEENGVTGTLVSELSAGNKLAQWMDELAPNRDPVSRFSVLREAEAQGIASKTELKAFLDKEPGFTTARLETSLSEGSQRLGALIDSTPPGKVSIDRSFLEGRFNPAKGPVRIHIEVNGPKAEAEWKAAIEKMKKADKKMAQFLDVQVTRGPPPKIYIRLPELPASGPDMLMDLYKDSAIAFGGLAATETRTGGLKFVQVAPGIKGEVRGNLAFFPPDADTTEALEGLHGGKTESFLKKEIAEVNKFAGPNDPWKIKYTVVDDLVGGNLAQIVPEIAGDAENLTIHLRITKKGLKNPAVVMEELVHLQQITGAPVPWKAKTNFKAFVHPFHWAEVVANSQAGSKTATEKLARLELEAANASEDAARYYINAGLFDKSEKEAIEKYLAARGEHAEELYTAVAKEAKAELKTKSAAWERAKKVFEKLETQSVKLNDLVGKGDRKGVRKLVESYLPWDLMEPSETKAWKEWLDAIEKPNKKNVKLVFRGMYDDFVFRTADGKPYLMSTVLTKNQGNYTRRLRSLSTMREKFGMEALRDADSVYNLGKMNNPGSISVMMANHAIEAKGSPFLSTASYDVATKFGPRQLGAFEIDERRLILNALSPDKYLYQHEMLTPLFIFPDEVAHFHDYRANPVEGVGPASPGARKQHFVGELEKKLGRKVTKAELTGVGDEKDFMKVSYGKLKEMILEKDELPKVGAACSIGNNKSCDCLFKTLNSLLK